MIKNLLKKSLLLLLPGMLCAQSAAAGDAVIKFKSSAPAGTMIRISSAPFNSAVITGVDESDYWSLYNTKGPDEVITVTGDVEQLEVFGCSLSELEVVEAPDLFILKCYNNELTSIDVSKAPKLAVLDCNTNKLGSIDVSSNPLLEELNAADNELSSVTLGHQPVMTKLDLSGNELLDLDLESCPALEDLYVQNNKLLTLDLSTNTKLWWMYAFGNQMEGEGMDNFIANLPEAAQMPGMLYIVDTKDDNEGNICLVKNVEAARDKGWVSCDWVGGADNGSMFGAFYYGADYVPSVSERSITLTTSRQAGETVKFYISASNDIVIEGVEESGPFTGTNTFTLTSGTVTIKGDVTTFECPDNDIISLSFTGKPLFTILDCSNNKLENLAVTNATSMTRLNCNGNALKTLNVEGCTGLYRLDCFDNQLKGNAMKSFMQSLPDGSANEPYLFVIDTADAAEGNVATTDDVAIAKEKSWVVFDWNGGANWGMGTRYEGSEPTEPEVPEEYFVFTSEMGSRIMFSVLFSDPAYTPVLEGCELSGWNGSTLTLRITSGEPAKVYGDAVEIVAPFCVITDIDVTNLPNLVTLNLALDELTSIDLSKNSKLETLSVDGNYLKTIDLSGCPALSYLNCYGNEIYDEGMSDMIASLPDRTGSAMGQLIVVDPTYSKEDNVCLVKDVAAARKLNWEVYSLDDEMMPKVYEGADYQSGVESVADAQKVSYDAASATVRLAVAADVEVYALTGVRVASFEATTEASLAELPAGIYIVRAGGKAMKVVR